MAEFFYRISEANGWAMALLGITIDMLCLATLALIISRVPAIVGFVERTGKRTDGGRKGAKGPDEDEMATDDLQWPLSDEGVRRLASVYRDCSAPLGGVFALADLYRVASEKGLASPHLAIRTFRELGLLVPAGEGKFTWKP